VVLSACGTTGAGDPTTTTTTSSTTTASSTSTSTTTSTATTEPTSLALTPQGLGPLQLGMTVEDATATGLVGEFVEGCEIASPRPLNAPLLELQGSVEANDGVLTSVTVRGTGAATEPGGVEPGDPLDEATGAWQAAGLVVAVDQSTEEVFGVWFVEVRNGGAPAFGSTVDPATAELGPITAPALVVCE
jgi:hypothetical protein